MKIYWKTFIGWIATLAGAAGCNVISNITGSEVCMYGCPTADYDVELTVTDESGVPIPGIQASEFGFQYNEATGEYSSRKVLSDEKGQIKVTIEHEMSPHIKLDDIDGEENGGEFESTWADENSLEIKQTAKGDGAWYTGRYKATGTVKMKKK